MEDKLAEVEAGDNFKIFQYVQMPRLVERIEAFAVGERYAVHQVSIRGVTFNTKLQSTRFMEKQMVPISGVMKHSYFVISHAQPQCSSDTRRDVLEFIMNRPKVSKMAYTDFKFWEISNRTSTIGMISFGIPPIAVIMSTGM